jgi:hypothetical protein
MATHRSIEQAPPGRADRVGLRTDLERCAAALGS